MIIIIFYFLLGFFQRSVWRQCVSENKKQRATQRQQPKHTNNNKNISSIYSFNKYPERQERMSERERKRENVILI